VTLRLLAEQTGAITDVRVQACANGLQPAAASVRLA
jgi:hypothetical protein